MMVQHCFGADKKKKGPLLIFEVVFNPHGPNSGAFIAHRWTGNGTAQRTEINKLIKHYREKDFNLIADYMEVAGI